MAKGNSRLKHRPRYGATHSREEDGSPLKARMTKRKTFPTKNRHPASSGDSCLNMYTLYIRAMPVYVLLAPQVA